MGETGIWPYLAIVVLIAFSAFFSGSEIGFASLNAFRVKNQAENSKKLSSRLVLDIFEHYDDALITILIGNNLVNIGSSALATVIAVSLMGDEGAWVATAVMTILILTFGEIVPKIVASRTTETFTGFVSLPLKALMVITKPIVWVIQKFLGLVSKIWEKSTNQGPTVTEDDLESIIDTVEDEGVIDEDRCDLLQSALDFDDVLAYEIITPRVDMISIDIDDDFDEMMETIESSPYTRIPVYEDTVDNIIGILHLNHVFKELIAGTEINIRDILMPVNFVHKTMALPDVLKTMKKKKCHMVIVTDEYGGTMGVLTMEDVLEQLVGDIWDESDVIEEEVKELADDTFEVDGDMRIYDFFEELDIDDRDFDDDNATLGGWAIEMLGDYPKAGDSFDYKNLTITIKELQNIRVTKLLVKVHPVREEEEEEI